VKNCKRRWIANVLIDENMKALELKVLQEPLKENITKVETLKRVK
jgi:hypothetical protein